MTDKTEPTITLTHDNMAISGTFPIPPLDSLNGGELHTIKVMSGVRAGELEEALTAGDFDVILGLAAVALTRAGRKVANDALMTLRPVDIDVVGMMEEDSTETPLSARPVSNGTGDDESSSGTSSEPLSVSPVSDPSPIGSPRLVTSATSP